MIKISKSLTYANYINIYLYLLKNFELKSLSKIIYSTICLIYCRDIDCSTTKRNDVISFYFSELNKGNAFSYEKLLEAIESMNILLENNIVKIKGQDIELIDKSVIFIKDQRLEKNSIKIFIDEIKSLGLKSFLSEVTNCV